MCLVHDGSQPALRCHLLVKLSVEIYNKFQGAHGQIEIDWDQASASRLDRLDWERYEQDIDSIVKYEYLDSGGSRSMSYIRFTALKEKPVFQFLNIYSPLRLPCDWLFQVCSVSGQRPLSFLQHMLAQPPRR